MQEQQIIVASGDYSALDEYLEKYTTILLVAGNSLSKLQIGKYFEDVEARLGIKIVRFSNFAPNPLYESVVEGVELFHKRSCEAIIAVGGGSAMDVAKCIKLYANIDSTENYLKQSTVPNDIDLLAVPTTAGTGSEATRYAVIYYNGEKQSVSDYSCIPGTVVFDTSALKTLPLYQKKVTMLDAFCHAIESFWSVNSNEESREYSAKAIRLVLRYMNAYLDNTDDGNRGMLEAANLAGKAINITQTTAGHAMCYKLTSLYGIAHGHAAALCVSKLFPYMIGNVNKCIDSRGEDYLKSVFADIAAAMGCDTADQATEKFSTILDKLELEIPKAEETIISILKNSVNPVRLKNNPVGLDEESIELLYRQILRK